MTEGGHHNVAGTVARCNETHGFMSSPSPSPGHGFKSDGSSVSTSSLGHCILADQGAPGLHTMADATGSWEAI